MSAKAATKKVAAESTPSSPQPADTPLAVRQCSESLFDGARCRDQHHPQRLLQSHGAEVVHLGHNRSVADIVRARHPGGCRRHRRAARTRAATTSTSSTWSTCCASRARTTSASSSAAAARSRRTRSEMLETHGVETHLHADDGLRMGLGGMIEDVMARVREVRRARHGSRAALGRARSPARSPARSRCSRTGDETRGSRALKSRDAEDAQPSAGHRHHRHRRRWQVVADRRAAESLRALLPGSPDRGRRDGSDAAPLRRRAARRSHPHERARQRAGLHALAGDTTPAPRDQRSARGYGRSCSSGPAST